MKQLLTIVLLAMLAVSCSKDPLPKVKTSSFTMDVSGEYKNFHFTIESSLVDPAVNGNFWENTNTTFSPAKTDTGTYLFYARSDNDESTEQYGSMTVFMKRNAGTINGAYYTGTGEWYLKETTGVYAKLKQAAGTLTYSNYIVPEGDDISLFSITYHLTGQSNR